jgi:hypothetical protein
MTQSSHFATPAATPANLVELTDPAVKAAAARPARYEIRDSKVAGLRLVVQPSGKRSFVIRYRNRDGDSVKFTLGPYPKISLKDARALAANRLLEVQSGRDPQREKVMARDEAAGADTVEHHFRIFDRVHIERNNRPSGARETRRLFEKRILPKIGRRKLKDITKRDVLRKLAKAFDTFPQAWLREPGRRGRRTRIVELLTKLFLPGCTLRHYVESEPDLEGDAGELSETLHAKYLSGHVTQAHFATFDEFRKHAAYVGFSVETRR